MNKGADDQNDRAVKCLTNFVCCAKKDKILNLQKLSEKGATSLNTPINKRKDKVKQVCVVNIFIIIA
jgi:hypothetical protein